MIVSERGGKNLIGAERNPGLDSRLAIVDA